MSLKNQVAQIICSNSASKQQKSPCEVLNKTYTVWDSYKITHCDIKAPGFSKLSIQIGYIFLKHPVYDHRLSDVSASLNSTRQRDFVKVKLKSEMNVTLVG